MRKGVRNHPHGTCRPGVARGPRLPKKARWQRLFLGAFSGSVAPLQVPLNCWLGLVVWGGEPWFVWGQVGFWYPKLFHQSNPPTRGNWAVQFLFGVGPKSLTYDFHVRTGLRRNQMTKNLSVEWARFGIRVNAVGPGAIETPLMETASKTYLADFKERANYKNAVGGNAAFLVLVPGNRKNQLPLPHCLRGRLRGQVSYWSVSWFNIDGFH